MIWGAKCVGSVSLFKQMYVLQHTLILPVTFNQYKMYRLVGMFLGSGMFRWSQCWSPFCHDFVTFDDLNRGLMLQITNLFEWFHVFVVTVSFICMPFLFFIFRYSRLLFNTSCKHSNHMTSMLQYDWLKSAHTCYWLVDKKHDFDWWKPTSLTVYWWRNTPIVIVSLKFSPVAIVLVVINWFFSVDNPVVIDTTKTISFVND